MNKQILYYRFKNINNNEKREFPNKRIETKYKTEIRNNKIETNYKTEIRNNNNKKQNLNNSFSKEFTNISEDLYEDDDENNTLAQSYSFSQINKYKEEFLKEPLNMVLDSYLYGRNNKNKKIKFITQADIAKLKNKILTKQSNINKEIEEYLEIRNNFPDDKQFEDNLKQFLNDNDIEQFYLKILDVKYRLNVVLPNNNISPIFTLEHLFEYIISNNKLQQNTIDLDSKYNKLKPIIYKYRQIKGDGNCYYRAVMFRYLEQIILRKDIILFKKIILDMKQCFESKEIKNRLYIKMGTTFKPELHLKIMVLILNLIEKNKIQEAHQLFVKCILSCAIFDFGLILYFRYILYLYIKSNENKLFSKSFPVKIGNLLPSIYENQKGEFEFSKFYINYLLKMFMDAEKIIIYLTPFLLGVNLDIIVFEDNEEQIVQRLTYDENNSENMKQDNVITLLNRNAHYDLIYTYEEYNKYSNIYNFYEMLEPNNSLEKSSDSNFFLLQTNRNKAHEHEGYNTTVKNIDNNTKVINNNIFNKNNNLINKDNNEKYTNNESNNKESNKLPEMKLKLTTETPFGHPECTIDDNYLNEIDNMFSNKNKSNNDCIVCKKKIKEQIQDKYNICNKCLENEILTQLKKNYSDYLKNLNNTKKKFKINPIKIKEYSLYLKDIIDILKLIINIKDEKELLNYLKNFVCIKCFEIVDNNKNTIVKFPCGCRICNKEELETYFTVQSEIKDNFKCICGYKYEPKDLYDLSIECNKVGSSLLILLIINIFNKSILSKGCSGCGKTKNLEKIEYEPEAKSLFCFENYLKLHNFNMNLDHLMCRECKSRYKNQKFMCFYCNRIHLYLPN